MLRLRKYHFSCLVRTGYEGVKTEADRPLGGHSSHLGERQQCPGPGTQQWGGEKAGSEYFLNILDKHSLFPDIISLVFISTIL